MTLTVDGLAARRRLDQYLQERLPEHSRSRLQDWIKAGRVRVNGATVKPSHELRGGETIDVEPAAPPPLKAEPEELPLTVLYEDEDVIAIDKAAGMVVHAGAGLHHGTVVNALLYRYGTLSTGSDPLRPGIVHRLDRHTSGVLLVARHDAAHRDLAAQFSNRTMEKVYLTCVHGTPPERATITLPITRDPVVRTRMTARLGHGRTAHTEYEVLQRWERFALLSVRIKTGRTHQIRVHLSKLGFPVVGDVLYGAPATVPGMPPLGRYFLHAHRLTFRSPSRGEAVTVESPLAAELAAWLNKLD